MANALRGEAALGEFTLVFDVNAFCDIEDATGFGISRLNVELNSDPSFSLIRTIIRAGLQAKHPGIDLLETGRIISDCGIEETGEAMMKALSQAMPEVADDTANPPKKMAKGGTG